MEIAIAVFLGAFLASIGVLCYVRVSKDFKDGDK